MSRKRSPLLVQVLLFLLGTLLAVATGVLTNSTGPLPWGLEFIGDNPCHWPASPCY